MRNKFLKLVLIITLFVTFSCTNENKISNNGYVILSISHKDDLCKYAISSLGSETNQFQCFYDSCDNFKVGDTIFFKK